MPKRIALLLLTLSFLGMSACPFLDPLPPPPTEPDCTLNRFGECVLATPSCDADTIREEGANTCASCDDGQVEICGSALIAECFSRVGSFGNDCQVCVNEDLGEVFNSCGSDEPFGPDVRCEEFEDGGLQCETCYNTAGIVVRQRCDDVAPDCTLSEPDDAGCQSCRTEDGTFVSGQCPAPTTDLRVCELYSDDDGRCVDCFDENNALIVHQCVFGERQEYCVSQQIGGDICEICTDDFGGYRETCRPFELAGRCEQIENEFESCLLCVDNEGNETQSLCERSCPEPGCDAGCQTSAVGDGSLCRVCPGIDAVCTSAPDVICGLDRPGCIECHDAQDNRPLAFECNVEQFPLCEATTDPFTNEPCDRCFFPETGTEFNSCQSDPQSVCTDFEGPLMWEGDPVLYPDEAGDFVAATAICSGCYDAQTYGNCELTSPCPSCASTFRYVLQLNGCDPAFAPQIGATPDAAQASAALMGVLMHDTGLPVLELEISGSGCDETCCSELSYVAVAPQSAYPAYQRLGFTVTE